MTKQPTYRLTLCDRDGALIAAIPDAPMLPRFMHLHRVDGDDGNNSTIEMSDDSASDPRIGDGAEVITFARVASSVWVEDDRAALFVRVPA